MAALRYTFTDSGHVVATVEVGARPKLLVAGAPALALTSTQLARTIAAWTASVQANAAQALTLDVEAATAIRKRAKKAPAASADAAPPAARKTRTAKKRTARARTAKARTAKSKRA